MSERGTTESRTESDGSETFILRPRFDDDHVRMSGASTGVLFIITDTEGDNEAAAFLTVDEIERLAVEARRIHAHHLAWLAKRRAGAEGGR